MDPYALTVIPLLPIKSCFCIFFSCFQSTNWESEVSYEVFLNFIFCPKRDLCFLDVRGKKKKEGIHLCQEERQTRPGGGGEWTEERRDSREMLVFHQKRIPPVASGLCILRVMTWPRGLPKLLPPSSPFQIVHLPWNGSPLGSWSPLYFLGDVNHGS